MSNDHGRSGFHFFGAPEIDKLENERYRVTVRCEIDSMTEDWYYSNEEKLFKNFGDLYSVPLKVGGQDADWAPITSGGKTEAYPDMALIDNKLRYVPNKDTPVVEFIYETLTSSWVKETTDKPVSTESGLRTLERTQVALPGTLEPYGEDDVNVATIVDGEGPDAMVVEGAGTSGANIVYLRGSGGFTVNDRPFYTEDGSTTAQQRAIGSTGSQWRITNSDGTAVLYDSGTENPDTPDLVDGWIEAEGDSPAPTVRRATWQDIIDAGLTPADYGGKTLYLAGFEDRSTDRMGRFVTRWSEAGVLSVRTPKVGGQQQVVVSALGLSQADVVSALSEVTESHTLVDVSKGNFKGFQTLDYTFEVGDFVVLTVTEGDLTVIRRTRLSATAIARGTINDTAISHNGGTYVLRQEELDNDGIIKKAVGFYVRFEQSSFPETQLFEIDRRYGVAVPVARKVVPFGTTGVIDGNNSVQVEPVDSFRSLQFKVLASNVPAQQVWYERRNVNLPSELKSVSVVGTETPVLIPNYREAPSSPLKVRVTRKFHWGPPPETVGDNVRDFRADPFSGAVEVTVTNNTTTDTTSQGSSTTTSNSTNEGTSSTQSTSQNTFSSTNSGTSNSTASGTSNSTSNGTASSTSSGTSNSTSSGTSNSTSSGTSSSNTSSTSQSSNSGTSSSTSSGKSSSTNSGTSSSSAQSDSNFSNGVDSNTASRIGGSPFISDARRFQQSSSTGSSGNSSSSTGTSDSSNQSTSESSNQSTSESSNQSTSESSNQSTSDSSRQSTSQGTSQNSSQGSNQSTSNSSRQNTSDSSRQSTSQSTNEGTSQNTGSSTNSTSSTNAGSSQNQSSSTSSSISASTGKRVVSLTLRACLRSETTVTVAGGSITIPATSPTALPWGEYIELSRQASHWKFNIWVEEIDEAFLPAL